MAAFSEICVIGRKVVQPYCGLPDSIAERECVCSNAQVYRRISETDLCQKKSLVKPL